MKFNSRLIKKAHQMVKKIKKEFNNIDYKVQFGLCLSYLLNEREDKKMELPALEGTEKQVKWANDIRKEVLNLNDYLLSNLDILKDENYIKDATECYTTSKNVIEGIKEAKVFIQAFKEITYIKECNDKAFTFNERFSAFSKGLLKLGLDTYYRLGGMISRKMDYLD